MQPRGVGSALVQHMGARPHAEMLAQAVEGSMAVPGERDGAAVPERIPPDTESGVTAMSEASAARIHCMMLDAEVLCPYDRRARIVIT